MIPTRWRLRLLWTGAALILLGTFALIQTYRHSFPTEAVLVAARSLSTGAALRPEDVRVAYVAPGTAPPGTLHQPAEVQGRWVSAGLLAGDFVRATHLSSEPPRILDQPEPDKAILSIPVTPADALAGVLRPGDTVSIWLTDAPLGKEASVQPLSGDAVVVAVQNSAGEDASAQESKGGSGLAGPSARNLVPAWVVLKLPNEDVAPLLKAVAQKQGIHFLLRQRGEEAPA